MRELLIIILINSLKQKTKNKKKSKNKKKTSYLFESRLYYMTAFVDD